MILTMVLGGARSAKSPYAQSLCASSSDVIYVAAARTDDGAGDIIARLPLRLKPEAAVT
jgi:adenosyl cobinamide kinase/adenosyl cobinamide phosphate guanylyltransferase